MWGCFTMYVFPFSSVLLTFKVRVVGAAEGRRKDVDRHRHPAIQGSFSISVFPFYALLTFKVRVSAEAEEGRRRQAPLTHRHSRPSLCLGFSSSVLQTFTAAGTSGCRQNLKQEFRYCNAHSSDVLPCGGQRGKGRKGRAGMHDSRPLSFRYNKPFLGLQLCK